MTCHHDWWGYRCTSATPHAGPCPLVPRWWNLPGWVLELWVRVR